MDKGSISVAVIIIISIVCVLKIAFTIHTMYISKIKSGLDNTEITCNLVSDTTSYDDFVKVSKESLRLNSPIRDQEDFLDFFIEHIDPDSKRFENQILEMRYGEDHDE